MACQIFKTLKESGAKMPVLGFGTWQVCRFYHKSSYTFVSGSIELYWQNILLMFFLNTCYAISLCRMICFSIYRQWMAMIDQLISKPFCFIAIFQYYVFISFTKNTSIINNVNSNKYRSKNDTDNQNLLILIKSIFQYL